MKVGIGSKNPQKVKAIERIFRLQLPEQDLEFVEVSALSGVSEQPMSHSETATGAQNRAKAAFQGSGWSVGVESGLCQDPVMGWCNICYAALYNGEEFVMGSSGMHQVDDRVIAHVEEHQVDVSAAMKALGFTDHERLGYSIGVIGKYSGDENYTRVEYIETALYHAFIYLNFQKEHQ